MTAEIISDRDYLSARQVIHLYKINRMTLYRLRKAGKLNTYGPTRSIYFLRSELDELFLKPKV